MRKALTAIVLLTTIFVGVGLGHRIGLSANPDQTWRFGVSQASTLVRDGRAQPQLLAPEKIAVALTVPQPVASLLPAPAISLSADATALVAEMCDLQLLAHDTELTLNSQQWSALAAVVLRTQAVRQTYEAEIATGKAIAPGQYRVEIPAYAGAGDVLREQFNAELRKALGAAKANDVLANLGDRLEGRFAGFGIGVQTLDITGNPGGALSEVQVTRTVTYWNSAEGDDRLTTRREIHFPAWEDPTGDSWSTLLAMVKA